MRRTVPPFAVSDGDCVRFRRGWHLHRGGVSELLGDRVSEWDHQTVLRLGADLEVDAAAARRTAHQGPGAGLAVVVSAASSSTRLRGPVWHAELASHAEEHLVVEIHLAGTELGGRLDLVTQLVVSDPEPVDELGATLPGAVIWRRCDSVLLEGQAAQFPTEAADLSDRLPKAAWLLEFFADDLDAAAAGAVRLVVNEAHPIIRRILDGERSPECDLALKVMHWDVARQLVEAALRHPDFVDRDGSFEEDSLGRLFTNVLATHFPGESPRSLRTKRERTPHEFESTLQHAARIFG
jgi:hypothetical protein